MAKNLDITLVRTFVAVAENASMTVAANALHLTQGAISQQIKRLEDAFECRLFARDGRRLELTHAGERFLGRAKRLLALNDEVWADMAARPLQGPVRLGVPYDLVGTVFPPIFKAFTEAWPSVELTIVCGTSPDLAEGIARGELDVAVVEAPVDEAAGECLCVERLVWVGARGGNVHAKRPLPLSMVDESCAFRARVLKVLGEHRIEWRTVFESGNIEATTATVRTGLAVTAWLTPTVPADLDILGPETGLPELPMFAISLLLPAQGASAAAQALGQCVRDGFSTRQRVGERVGERAGERRAA